MEQPVRALIAMSGGVDSSLAAKLIKDAGYDCVGCTMKLYGNEDIGVSRGHTCCTLEDAEDARSIAYNIGMPYCVFNFTDDFREKVISKFVSSYEHALTPNPCIDCGKIQLDKRTCAGSGDQVQGEDTVSPERRACRRLSGTGRHCEGQI